MNSSATKATNLLAANYAASFKMKLSQRLQSLSKELQHLYVVIYSMLSPVTALGCAAATAVCCRPYLRVQHLSLIFLILIGNLLSESHRITEW